MNMQAWLKEQMAADKRRAMPILSFPSIQLMGITVKEDAGRGWRQVVASPIPKRIVEFDAVRDQIGRASCRERV